MRLLQLIEKTKKGKFGRSQTYSLYMPNGGEDGVLIGWRADWPENKWVEFRGPPYSQWEGTGSDFELVHDALEGRHATVLHTNDVLDVLPTHPRYDLIKHAIDNDAMPPRTPGYAFEAHQMDEVLGEARGIAPDMAAAIVHKKDLPKYQAWKESGEKHMPYGLHTYRVTGWYCPKTPPKLTKDNVHDNMHDILSQMLWDTGDDFDKMRPCQRKDATHVTGSGVAGLLAPIEDVAVVGRVNWSPEQIQQEKNSWNKRVMMGESITEEVVPFTKQWAPSDIALTKIWQIVQALIKKGMGDELNGLFDNFKFAIQQYNELAAERSQHSELAELSDRHLHQIYEYGKKVHWQPLSRAGFKARQRMIAQSWGKEVTEGILDVLPPGARKLATGLALLTAMSGAHGHESELEHPPKHPSVTLHRDFSERLSAVADIIGADNPDRYGQWVSNLYAVYQDNPDAFQRMFGTEYETFLDKARNSSPQEMGAYMKAMAKSFLGNQSQ